MYSIPLGSAESRPALAPINRQSEIENRQSSSSLAEGRDPSYIASATLTTLREILDPAFIRSGKYPRQGLRCAVNFSAMLGIVTKTLRAGLGLVLSFWIAGAGCMFGCQNMLAAAAVSNDATSLEQDHATIVSGDACASSGAHDCCAKKKAATSRGRTTVAVARPSLQTAALISQTESFRGGSSGSRKDCPLALSRAVAVTKSIDSKQVAVTFAPAPKALFVAPSPERQTSLASKARLPNRGHTYLSCCVFLI